jgi:protein-tyrosine phosphatase
MNKVRKLEDNMRRRSPLKKGLYVKDEDDPVTDYSKMSNRIYLGNIEAANDKKFFKDKKIRAVLNCTKDVKNYFEKDPKVEYMRIPVDDSLKEVDFKKLYNFFPVIVEFIYKHVDIEKKNVYIHCMQGRQRSISSLCAYLIAKKKFTAKMACEYSMKKRPEAFHFGTSLNFSAPLVKFEEKIKKKKC